MPTDILMPALSPTMTEGNLAKWHKKVGDTVSAGDVVAEIETDKATMEVEAVDEGTLGKILVDEGAENVPVNQPIAVLLDDGEDESVLENYTPKGALSVEGDGDGKEEEEVSANEAPALEGAQPAEKASAPLRGESGRVFASPLARRIARDEGLDLTQIAGSGPHGRIVKTDIEQALSKGTGWTAPAAAQAASAAPATKPAIATDNYELKPHSGMRKVVARRMAESKATVPHFYGTVEVRIDDLLSLRKDLNAQAEAAGEEIKLSVNDFIVKAVARALRQKPEVNVSYTDEGMIHYNDVDISVAVAVPGGLITPVIRKADQKGLAQISAEMKDFAARARQGKLMPEEYQGGGFSISNLGMYGIKHFDAIINPPQACILAVGAGEQQPAVIDGALGIATVMNCTLSIDHRAVDGALGAEFLSIVKRMLEHPLSMML